MVCSGQRSGSATSSSRSGSSGGSMVQVWGALAPTRLLLFLLVTLGVQDAQSASWRARTLAVPVSSSHRVSQVHHVQQPHGDPTDVATNDRYPHTRVASRAHTARAGTDMAGDEEYSSSQKTPGTKVPGDGVTVPAGDGHRSCQTPPVLEPQGDHTDTADGDGHPASKHGLEADLPEDPVAVLVADGDQASKADPDLESQNVAADVVSDDGQPASQLGSKADGLEDSVKEVPSLSPWTDHPLEVTWNPRDPQMAKNNAKPRKCFHRESAGLLKELLEVVEAVYKTRHESREVEVLQEGSSHAEPVSDEERRAVQSTGVPVLSTPRQSNSRNKFLEMNPRMNVDSSAPYPKAFWKYLIVCSMALSVLVAIVLCCVICLWRKRKQRLSAAPAAQTPTSSCPSLVDSHQAHPSSPKTQTQSQQMQPVLPMLSHLPRSP